MLCYRIRAKHAFIPRLEHSEYYNSDALVTVNDQHTVTIEKIKY